LTLGVRGGGAPELFEQASNGASVSARVNSGDEVAKRLFRFGVPTLAGADPKALPLPKAIKAFQSDADYDVVLFRTAPADRGLYLTRVKDLLARFVGYALEGDYERVRDDAPSETDELNWVLFQAIHSISSTVSAGAAAQFGRRF